MKHFLTTTLFFFSTQTFAGGSETKPLFDTISFDGSTKIATDFQLGSNSSFNITATPQPLKINGEVITISNPIVVIDADVDDGEGGVESKPKVPSPYPQFIPPKKVDGGNGTDGGNDGIFWPEISEDGSDDLSAITTEGGSETIAVPIKWASIDVPLEVETIRYYGGSDDSVILQINQGNQFIKLQDTEVYKIKNLSDLIDKSASENSIWIKTN